MAPAIMGNPDRPELGEELTNSFCRTDPEIAKQFARVTFTSDNRADLPKVDGPDADPAVQRRHHRRRSRSASTCTRSIPAAVSCCWRRPAIAPTSARRRKSSPAIRDLCLIAVRPTPDDDLEDLFEKRPAATSSLAAGRAHRQGQPDLCRWIGVSRREARSASAFSDLLNIAGRIFYETHFAPLLRMQGFFDEVALDWSRRAGEPLPVIANAAEQRDPDGSARVYTRSRCSRPTDRRRYERELLKAREPAQAASAQGANARPPSCASSSSPCSATTCAIRWPPSAPAPQPAVRGVRRKQASARSSTMMQAERGPHGGADRQRDGLCPRPAGRRLSLERRSEALVPVLHQVVDELRTAMPIV